MTETLTPEQDINHVPYEVLCNHFEDLLESAARSVIVLSQMISFGATNKKPALIEALAHVDTVVTAAIEGFTPDPDRDSLINSLTTLESAIESLVEECHRCGINGKPDVQDAAGLVVANLDYYIKNIKNA